jgi:hypothetical protein
MDCTGHPTAGPEGIEFLRDSGFFIEMGQFTDGIQMLNHARHKYPWFDMQTLYPFDEKGVNDAVADAMAMRTVKSTIVPWPELARA